ncbi:MAG: SIS domain-containing protein [Minisyncoccia bacterium]
MLSMMQEYIKESIALEEALAKDQQLAAFFTGAVDAVCRAMQAGNKVLIAGNGGSAADTQHFAAEFVGKYKMKRAAYPAIALTTDTSLLTAWSNDEGFEGVFERQVEALGRAGDVFFGISTSGNSENIIRAIKAAKQKKIVAVALLGGDGGRTKEMADLEFIVPSRNTPRVQEMHTLILHSIAEEVEKRISGAAGR